MEPDLLRVMVGNAGRGLQIRNINLAIERRVRSPLTYGSCNAAARRNEGALARRPMAATADCRP
jgi:hypothetical protein